MGTSLGIQLHSELWPLLMGNQVARSQSWEKPRLDCSREDALTIRYSPSHEEAVPAARGVSFLCSYVGSCHLYNVSVDCK